MMEEDTTPSIFIRRKPGSKRHLNVLIQRWVYSTVCDLKVHYIALALLNGFLVRRKPIVVDKDFKMYYCICVYLAAKLHNVDDQSHITLDEVYEGFVLCGEYIFLQEFYDAESEVFSALEENLGFVTKQIAEILLFYKEDIELDEPKCIEYENATLSPILGTESLPSELATSSTTL
jgi:hypothetical protein